MRRPTFERIVPPDAPVTIVVDGPPVAAVPGETLLAALVANGLLAVRRRPSGAPPAPVGGMGVCMDCQGRVEGRGMVRSCAEPVHEGLVCSTGLAEDPS